MARGFAVAEGDTVSYRMYRDVQGSWRWRLVAGNGRIIADSGEGYHSRQDCRYAIDLVKGSGGAQVFET